MPEENVMSSMWVGGRLSTMARLSIHSFLAHGHPFHLYTYDGIENPPPGTTVLDAREVLSEDRRIRQQHGFARGSYAPFADLFRYNLLWQRGGWWTDLDMICLRPWDLDAPRVVASRWEPTRENDPINCVLKSPPGDPVIGYCLEACEKVDLATAHYGAIGPVLVGRAVEAAGAQESVVPFRDFCPIGYRQAGALVGRPLNRSLRRIVQRVRRRPALRIGPESYGVHLWHEKWRHNGYDVEASFHPSSWYEQWKAAYLPAGDR